MRHRVFFSITGLLLVIVPHIVPSSRLGPATDPAVLSATRGVAADTVPRNGDRPRIVAFGNSLTAGLGVPREQTYPALLEQRLESMGYQYRVINAGVSGDTTAGGLRRVPWILKSLPALVILELGANDGLRGLSLEQTKANLDAIIRLLQEARVTVVLAGMKLPPNYGQNYTRGFEALYADLARRYGLVLIPFFLDGVAANPALNQSDGIHPTGEGYKRIVETVLTRIEPLLSKPPPRPGPP
ncbi:MAG: arylesterase [Nitrospiraceae bacterium]